MRRIVTTLFFLFPFLGSILLAHVWFRSKNARSDSGRVPLRSGLRIGTTTNIPGYRFISEPVGESVMKGLETTNIVSGSFYRLNTPKNRTNSTDKADTELPFRITVFLASWSAESETPLNVLGHSPDICWIGAGWKVDQSFAPRSIHVVLPAAKREISTDKRSKSEMANPGFDRRRGGTVVQSRTLEFHVQTFELPGTARREIAAWCALAEGGSFSSGSRIDALSPESFRSYFRSRAVLAGLLAQAVARRSACGAKQFIRFSSDASDDPQTSVAALRAFAEQWLTGDGQSH